MNAFHVAGGLLAIYAVVLTALGLTREDFPGERGARIVGVLSALFVLATIAAAIITAANEDHGSEHEERSAQVSPGRP